MAINYSMNKVRVRKLLKTDAVVGLMDPQVGMITDYGKILSLDSGNYQVTVGVGQGALAGNGTVQQKFYPHQLSITYTAATGSYSFPSSNGSVQFGHGRTFPNGVRPGLSSGIVELGGDGNMHVVVRPPTTYQ